MSISIKRINRIYSKFACTSNGVNTMLYLLLNHGVFFERRWRMLYFVLKRLILFYISTKIHEKYKYIVCTLTNAIDLKPMPVKCHLYHQTIGKSIPLPLWLTSSFLLAGGDLTKNVRGLPESIKKIWHWLQSDFLITQTCLNTNIY